jgi:WNK lysine deficient protein kinase
LTEYADDTDIDVFVRDCAIATHRNMDKATEWIKKLQSQDIMTVGDLRDLHDEDWAGIGLTVFALRALKNMLKGKKLAGQAVLALNNNNTHSNASSAPSSAGIGSP